jgi:dATP pyrophosphohydrolase
MKTNKQAEIIVFKKEGKDLLFLILKRNPQKGGFWQPITGGVEEGETFEETAIREVKEEIGITDDFKLIDINYSFEFIDHGENHIEKVFGLEISPNEKIILSEEHTKFKWVDGQVAIDQFLKYPNNKEGFRKIMNLFNK